MPRRPLKQMKARLIRGLTASIKKGALGQPCHTR
jgi:hypothetical protein